MVVEYLMYIDGKMVPAQSGEVLESIDPFSQQVWATFPHGIEGDVDVAVRAAARAADDETWTGNPRLRSRLLNDLADAVQARADDIAAVESRDNGKTIREELGMNRAAPSWYRYAAAVAQTVVGETPRGADPAVLSITEREPYGVVGIQTPWNTPSVLLAQMASMALAAGNTIVVKPSELAPCSILELARCVDQVGFPPGVFNIVTGLGPVVGQSLCDHPLVDKLTMTGGPDAGRIVAARAAQRLVPAVMELGGKSANIVFPDVDMDEVARAVVAGFTGAGGQSCVAGTRALVHRSIYAAFVDRLVAEIDLLTLGDPADLSTDIGPMCTSAQVERVQRYVYKGVAEGATLRVGGRRPEHEGTLFFPPVLFTDVRPTMSIAREEIFGPVLSVLPFDSETQAVELNNSTAYGLAAGIWTNDIDRAHRVAHRLKVGTVWVNHYRRGDAAFPFGGYGESGYGRVNGLDGYREMSRVKSIQVLLRTTSDD